MLKKYFSRFQGLLELLEERLKEELLSVQKLTEAELSEMIAIEQSSIYLSH